MNAGGVGGESSNWVAARSVYPNGLGLVFAGSPSHRVYTRMATWSRCGVCSVIVLMGAGMSKPRRVLNPHSKSARLSFRFLGGGQSFARMPGGLMSGSSGDKVGTAIPLLTASFCPSVWCVLSICGPSVLSLLLRILSCWNGGCVGVMDIFDLSLAGRVSVVM